MNLYIVLIVVRHFRMIPFISVLIVEAGYFFDDGTVRIEINKNININKNIVKRDETEIRKAEIEAELQKELDRRESNGLLLALGIIIALLVIVIGIAAYIW